jgi:hypothetical protein
MAHRSVDRARQGGQALIGVLQRLVPLARRLVVGVRMLAIAAAASIVVVAGVVLAHGRPGAVDGTALVLLVALMVPAPVVLWIFHGALREVLALPEWLQRSPDLARGHASELAGLVAESRRRDGRRRGGFVGDSVRAGRLLLQAHDDLPGYGAALKLVSPVFLIAVAIATIAAAAQILFAGTVVVADVALRTFT